VPEEWVFEDEGHSGATLVRPGLEALRDLAAQGCLDVVLVYSPDRLARKFAYRAEVRVEFVTNGARDDSPEDQLLVTHARAPPQGRENPLKPPLTRPRTFRDDKFR
jgi:site-specific DNA recombinase